MKRYLCVALLLQGAVACVQQPPKTPTDSNEMQTRQQPDPDRAGTAAAVAEPAASPSSNQSAPAASPSPGTSAPSPAAPGAPSSTRPAGAESPSPNVPNSMPQPDAL